MKHILLAAVMLLYGLGLAGQREVPVNGPWEDEKFFNAGYSLGFNVMTFKINPSDQFTDVDSLYADGVSVFPGINLHLALNFRLNQFFDIRLLPGISFGQRNLNFSSSSAVDTVFSPQKIESSFFEIPLHVRYGWRMQNIKPYLIGGVNYRYDFYAQEKYRIERPVYLRLNKPDIYYEAGAGIGFYLKSVRLSLEIKMSNGIQDVLAHDPHPDYPEYTNSITSLKSRMWVFSLHFE
ncbi:MAG: outer membrane beta-barrel protein [Bacteroidales bacterium]|jgi:hypothetical protein|nr:outer membrane beta-barrel protein [Bacteroidales bacterium]